MNDHKWTLEHLAWYINGTLVGNEYARAHRHLKDCLVCQQEHLALSQIGEAVSTDNNTRSDSASALSEVIAKIDEASPSYSPWWRRCTTLLAATPNPIKLAVLAQSLLLVGAAMLWAAQTQNPSSAVYETLSGAAVTEGDVRILFKPSASVAAQTQLLNSVEAQIIQGPSERGIYTLALPADTDHHIMRHLSNHPSVELALPLGRLLEAQK